MKWISTLLLVFVVHCHVQAAETTAKCYSTFRVCTFWLEVDTGRIVNFEDLPSDFVEQQEEREAFTFYCYGRDTGLINEVTTNGLASDGKMCGETFAQDGMPQPCGYTRWDRNDSSCIEP